MPMETKSGFAGLAASAEAAAAGAKVVLPEKMPTYGGNSIISKNSLAVACLPALLIRSLRDILGLRG